MIFIKLFLFVVCINEFRGSQIDYCEICLNHTLCKYKTKGASNSCKSYDNTALLSGQDIIELVNRINERRNFVAMGYSKVLPQAANMKKIRYSSELANFAQRWVDQCDPSVHPDKEDQCRDLENMEVGQNIGSVIGRSPGLSVKSFVEMWFIQLLDYTGSVTYYNRSQDSKTNYFTQLIWADTEFVGCGKAKFYVDERNVMLERLVCNFAPRGNIHGKPVYSIGFPATQCKDKMIGDIKYKGLCTYEDYETSTKRTTQKRSMNSLLKILNLSNNPMKYEIDPIRSNFKQINDSSNSRKVQRNQKTRHIIPNKTYVAAKRVTPQRRQNIWKSLMNITRNDDEYLYQHERGHSHLYHGNDAPRYNYEMTTVLHTNQDFRSYDFTTEPMTLLSYHDNYRKYNQNPPCTRRIKPHNNCASNQCTREQQKTTYKEFNEGCQQTTCPSACTEISCTISYPVEDFNICPTSYMPPTLETCPCIKQTCPPISTNYNFMTFCQCGTHCPTNTPCFATICPGLRRKNNDINEFRRTSSTYQYYDMIPNVVVRSGKDSMPEENSSQKENLPIFDNSDIRKSHKSINEDKGIENIHKDLTDNSKHKFQDRDYLYHSFDHSLRKRRQYEDQITVKPFWEIENFNRKKPSQLKSIKYTTLANKRHRNTRRNSELPKWSINRELITPHNVADYDDDQDAVTEKFLSFDELMHLRKINDEFALTDFRRQEKKEKKDKKDKKEKSDKKDKDDKKSEKKDKDDKKGEKKEKDDKKTEKKEKDDKKKEKKDDKKDDKNDDKKTTKKATTTKPPEPLVVTTEYTANTPFERKKHCTRKLTCTWTAFTSNDKDGGGGDGSINGPIDIGSRTPPGYVEGCTRTSTCTRDFMDRNKVSTLSTDSSESKEPTPEDEDYCERRSLNVQRRNSDEKKSFVDDLPKLGYPDSTDFPITILTHRSFNRGANSFSESATESVSRSHECICYIENNRKKRHEFHINGCCYEPKKWYSYSDLYYKIINKILKSNQENKYNKARCPCNCSMKSSPVLVVFFIIFCIHFNDIIILSFFNKQCVQFY